MSGHATAEPAAEVLAVAVAVVVTAVATTAALEHVSSTFCLDIAGDRVTRDPNARLAPWRKSSSGTVRGPSTATP
ncbi:MAG: hypothetical protein HOV92_29195, partial [Streptomyces sp.]|nr:hypothetical protein [Streptomyces sp.]